MSNFYKLRDMLDYPLPEVMKLISYGIQSYPVYMGYELQNGNAVFTATSEDGSSNATTYPDNPALRNAVAPRLPQYNDSLKAFTLGG